MNPIVDLNDAFFRANPYPTYVKLRGHHTFSSRGFQLLLTPHWFADQIRARSILAKDPPVYTRLRSLVDKAFTPSVIQQLEAGMAQVADDLPGGFGGAPRVEFLGEFSCPCISRIIGRIIGFEPEVFPQIKLWLDVMAQIRPTPPSLLMPCEIRASQDDMIAHSRRLIAERRRQPRADLLSHLVRAGTEVVRVFDGTG